MSIKARLIITIAFLLTAGILGMTGAVVLDARPRVASESESTARLTESLIRSSLVALDTAHDPRATLDRLVANLASLRHAEVSLASKRAQQNSTERTAPSLWISLMSPEESPPLEIPVHVKDELIDTLIVTPLPQDELQEVWAAIGRILEYGVLLAVVLIALTSLLITRSLKPIQTLTHALHELEDGNFAVEIPEAGPPEIAESCRQLNTLAKALTTSRAKILELSARIVQVQDEERRDVVRELHDDLGPHLFALRARAAALERGLLKETPDLDRATEDAAAIVEHIEAVQQTNRRVLHRLVPAGLLELGLSRAIAALGSTWRKEQPQVTLTMTLPERLEHLSESASLTIYRVCQEALTNAYRHADARNIRLGVALRSADGRAQMEAKEAQRIVHITVSDDGRGMPSTTRLGRGLQGMRERVVALGGTLDLSPNTPAGFRLDAQIPI